MNKRIENLYNQVRVRKYPFSIEKARLFTEGYKMYEGEPEILRTAKAQAYMLENIPIFLMEGDLIAGSPAAYPMAIEAEFWTRACWTPEGIESLRSETEYIITDEQAEEMYKMSEYWHRYAPDYKMLDLFDEELWAWKHSGFLLPKNKTREESAGMGLAINGLGIFPDAECVSVDHGYVLGKGLQAIIDEAKEELSKAMGVNITSKEDIERIYTLKAMIAINEGVIKWMARYADLAEKQALECQDEKRKAELYSIAETCRRIPGKPAETFQDAITFAWIIFVMVTKMNTTPLGRVDQYLYPYYKHDIEAGILDDEKVLEYLQCYRLKVMQMKSTSGGQHRKKWSGQARWNGVTLGGVKPDGTDACNVLTLLFMEAANRCRTPQHTLTLRVHKNMPKEVMRKALELVRTGIGMPSFVSDDNYIDTLVAKGIPLEKARDYFIIGCLDVNVPEGFGALFSMTVTALPFDTFLHNGYSPIQNLQVGPKTGDPRDMKTFEEFQDKLLEHYKYYLDCYAKERLLRYLARLEVFQDSFGISLFSDGVKVGQSGMKRKMPYEIGPTIGMGVGTINVCDSLNVIKKLVYDEKKLTMDELINALDANWEGERNQEIRKMCLDVVKYGNDDDYADAVASEFYGKLADLGLAIPSWRGTKYCMGAISITAHEPGGKLLGATPDGRYAGTMLADGCASPIQGADVNGPTAVLNSADKLPQHKFQSMLLNMKFHPNALKTDEDLDKLAVMIHTYLENGGKQIQFNAVDTETLKAAQKNPEAYRDLIVRVAGYSTYFVLLSQDMQNEIIRRTCYEAV